MNGKEKKKLFSRTAETECDILKMQNITRIHSHPTQPASNRFNMIKALTKVSEISSIYTPEGNKLPGSDLSHSLAVSLLSH